MHLPEVSGSGSVTMYGFQPLQCLGISSIIFPWHVRELVAHVSITREVFQNAFPESLTKNWGWEDVCTEIGMCSVPIF